MCFALAFLSSISVFAQEGEDKPTPPVKYVIVEGQVTDPIGAGQKDVSVTVRWKASDGSKGDLIAAVTTDAMGDFVVTASQPIKGDVWVTLSKPKFADLVREVRVGEDESPPFLGEVLEGALAITGKVTDALTQNPVAAASVLLRTHGPDRKERTDDQGAFRIGGVSPGDGELIVEADGYGRELRKLGNRQESSDLNVSLKPQRILHLQVVDDVDRPVRGVTVECVDEPRGDFRTMMTDEGGATTIRGVHFDASRLGVRLTHRDFVSDGGFDRTISNSPKELESNHRLVMARAGRITGRVTAAGQSLHGARVVTGEVLDDVSPRDWTDDEGRFEIAGVQPGLTTVTVHASGHAPELKVAEVKAGEPTTVDLTLQPATVLEGFVIVAGQGPAANVEVVAGRWRSKNTLGLRAMTDASGRFRMQDAPTDEFEIHVAGPAGDVSKTVNPSAGAIVELLVPRASPSGSGQKKLLTTGDPAPQLIVKTITGDTLNFAELRGKTVLVEFWATWCPPCLEEMPHLIALHEAYGKRKDFMIIGINRDHELITVTDYLKNNPKIAWPQVFGDRGGVSKACEAFGVTGIPELFVIGPEGKIIDAQLRGPGITHRVESLLNERSSE